MISGLLKFYIDIYTYKDVVVQLVKQYLQMRYKRTVLGFVWTLLTPLVTMIVMSVVFSLLLRFGMKDYVIYLFAGLIPWWLFANGLHGAGVSLLQNEGIIKKIYLPKQVFPTASLLGVVIDSLFSTTALFVILLFMGASLSPSLLLLPLSFLILSVFVYGLVLIQSVAVVYYRDLQHIIPILLQTLFYLTPILYPESYIPEDYRWFLDLNPMKYFLDLFRSPVYYGVAPSALSYAVAAALALVAVLFGMKMFISKDDDVVFRM